MADSPAAARSPRRTVNINNNSEPQAHERDAGISSSSSRRNARGAANAKISTGLRPAEFDVQQHGNGDERDGRRDEERERDVGIGNASASATRMHRRDQSHSYPQNHQHQTENVAEAAGPSQRSQAPESTAAAGAGPVGAETGRTRRVPGPEDPQAGNPNPFEQASPAERRELYPAFDDSGRRVGIQNSRHAYESSSSSPVNDASGSASGYFSQEQGQEAPVPVPGMNGHGHGHGHGQANGGEGERGSYYRKHVHEYNGIRRPILEPTPSGGHGQTYTAPPSRPSEPGPITYSPTHIYPASSSLSPLTNSTPNLNPTSPIASGPAPLHQPNVSVSGIPTDAAQSCIGSFSTIQNRPKTPHEVLGLPFGSPLNLWSLPEPQIETEKPKYNYHVLVKLAILGNKGEKATLQEILRAIKLRFPYYANLSKQEMTAFGNSVRHLLSLLAAFVREPKPVTEPGKGAYWRVDFSRGEGNKRVRKRNKRKKEEASGSGARAAASGSGKGKAGSGGAKTGNAREPSVDADGDGEVEDDEDTGAEEPPPSLLEGSVGSVSAPASVSVATTIEETAKQQTKKGARMRKAAVPKAQRTRSAKVSAAGSTSESKSPATMNNPVIDPALVAAESGGGLAPSQREGEIGAQRAHTDRKRNRNASAPYPPPPPAASSPGPGPALTSSEHTPAPVHVQTPVAPTVMALAHSRSSELGSLAGSPDMDTGHLRLNPNGVGAVGAGADDMSSGMAYRHQHQQPDRLQQHQHEHHQSQPQSQQQTQTQPSSSVPNPNNQTQAAAYQHQVQTSSYDHHYDHHYTNANNPQPQVHHQHDHHQQHHHQAPQAQPSIPIPPAQSTQQQYGLYAGPSPTYHHHHQHQHQQAYAYGQQGAAHP